MHNVNALFSLRIALLLYCVHINCDYYITRPLYSLPPLGNRKYCIESTHVNI